MAGDHTRLSLPSIENAVPAGEYLGAAVAFGVPLLLAELAAPLAGPLAAFVVGALGIALLMTKSRGPLVGAAVGCGTAALLGMRRRHAAAALAVGALAVVLFALLNPGSRVAGSVGSRAARSRAATWSATVDLIAERPAPGSRARELPGPRGRVPGRRRAHPPAQRAQRVPQHRVRDGAPGLWRARPVCGIGFERRRAGHVGGRAHARAGRVLGGACGRGRAPGGRSVLRHDERGARDALLRPSRAGCRPRPPARPGRGISHGGAARGVPRQGRHDHGRARPRDPPGGPGAHRRGRGRRPRAQRRGRSRRGREQPVGRRTGTHERGGPGDGSTTSSRGSCASAGRGSTRRTTAPTTPRAPTSGTRRTSRAGSPRRAWSSAPCASVGSTSRRATWWATARPTSSSRSARAIPGVLVMTGKGAAELAVAKGRGLRVAHSAPDLAAAVRWILADMECRRRGSPDAD